MTPIIRSVLTVLGAFFVVAVLVGLTTAVPAELMLGSAGPGAELRTAFLVVNLTYSVPYTIVGGYVAATVSDRSPAQTRGRPLRIHDAAQADHVGDQRRPASTRTACMISVGDHSARSTHHHTQGHTGYAAHVNRHGPIPETQALASSTSSSTWSSGLPSPPPSHSS
jgi:hypothetical protein